jgi:hypothetical protein
MHAPAAAHVTQLANKVYNIAAGLLSIVQPTPGSAEYRTLQQGPRWVCRCIGLASHIRLYGEAQVLQARQGAFSAVLQAAEQYLLPAGHQLWGVTSASFYVVFVLQADVHAGSVVPLWCQHLGC